MMRLLQCGTGVHADLMRLSEPRHTAWCARHGLQHSFLYPGENVEAKIQKYVAIRDALNTMAHGDVCLWVDADALIVGDEDPKPVLKGDLGMVLQGGSWVHPCLGVVFFRKTTKVIEWANLLKFGSCRLSASVTEALGLPVEELPKEWHRTNDDTPVQIRHWPFEDKQSVLRKFQEAL